MLEEYSPLTSKGLCDDHAFPVATDLSHRTHVIHTSGTTSEPEKVQDGMTRWELYANMPIYGTTNTDRVLADYPGGLEFPMLDETLMRKYIDHLKSASR